jgi:hypothetical protein
MEEVKSSILESAVSSIFFRTCASFAIHCQNKSRGPWLEFHVGSLMKSPSMVHFVVGQRLSRRLGHPITSEFARTFIKRGFATRDSTKTPTHMKRGTSRELIAKALRIIREPMTHQQGHHWHQNCHACSITYFEASRKSEWAAITGNQSFQTSRELTDLFRHSVLFSKWQRQQNMVWNTIGSTRSENQAYIHQIRGNLNDAQSPTNNVFIPSTSAQWFTDG